MSRRQSVIRLLLVLGWLSPIAAHPGRAEEQMLVGVTEPIREVKLSLPVDGIVAELDVKEADWVEQGASILSLASRLEALEVERRRLVLEDRSQLEFVRARRKTVRAILDSTRALYRKSGGVSHDELMKTELEYQETAARESELELQEAREKAELEMARERLRERRLVAPIAGVITELRTNVGQRAGTGEPVAWLVDPRQCHLVVNVDEKFVRRFEKGRSYTVEIQAGSQWLPKTASLVSVSPVADPASRLVRIRFEFDNADTRVWPGVPGRVTLPSP